MRRVLGWLFTMGPFVAGAIAALSARRDVRMLAMALAATLVARLVVGTLPARWERGAIVGAAFAASTSASAAVAIALGGRALFGVGAVAVVLGSFATAGVALGRSPLPAAERRVSPDI